VVSGDSATERLPITMGRVPARRPLSLVVALLTVLANACTDVPPPSSGSPSPVGASVPLDLRVRNSGLPGGLLWVAVTGDGETGRWHRLGTAEFLCVTCPQPLPGIGPTYDLAVLDGSCQVREAFRTVGGPWQIEIDPGPTVKLIPAPPLGDWLPADSDPAEPTTIPCSPP
jgi:hypothetical protein